MLSFSNSSIVALCLSIVLLTSINIVSANGQGGLSFKSIYNIHASKASRPASRPASQAAFIGFGRRSPKDASQNDDSSANDNNNDNENSSSLFSNNQPITSLIPVQPTASSFTSLNAIKQKNTDKTIISKKETGTKNEMDQPRGLALVFYYMLPWRNPNSIFVYMFGTVYVLGKISEAKLAAGQ